MNLIRLIRQNIRYFSRSWALTLAGAIIGTAVLTGALITGDSVRYSLNELVRIRLGETLFALAPADRYFRQMLAHEMAAASGFTVVPLLRTQGIVTAPDQKLTINRAEIIGVTGDFLRLWQQSAVESDFVIPSKYEAVISRNMAKRLHVGTGDFLVVRISKEGFAPANAPFVSEKSETSGIRLKIKAVASDRSGGSFSLANNQSAPFNIFVSQELLASKMGMPGFVNTLLIAGAGVQTGAESLNTILRDVWTLEDAGLTLSEPVHGIYQIVSRRIFIEDTLSAAIREAIPGSSGILTYLVNDISIHGKSTPYSFVTAAAPGVAPSEPQPGKIVITNWLSADLGAKVGDSLTLRYWVMGSNRSLKETTSRFMVNSVIPDENSEAGRALMPDFPGMKNSGNCRDWETGAPVDLSRIRDKDEAYWNKYKGTPKAWISLTDGKRIWKNPFGSHTTFRFRNSSEIDSLTSKIRELNPTVIGLGFTPVFEAGLRAAGNSTDFGELFLSLGGLIVIAGLMLSGMIFSFFLRQRIEEITLMRALGFRNREIMTIFLSETLIVSAAGGFFGVLAAIGYSQLIIYALNTIWLDAVNTSTLIVSVSGKSLITGFLCGVILNVMVFSFIIYKNRRRSLPSPYNHPTPKISGNHGFRKFTGILAVVPLIGIAFAIILFETLSGRFYPSPAFMISGILILAGTIICIAMFLSLKSRKELNINSGIFNHAMKNGALHKSRTLTAITLLALGVFTILVTGLNRKSGGQNDDLPGSGTGGFRLWMETTMPILSDLNTTEGKKRAGLEDDPLLRQIRFVPLASVKGDDASCLNLNETSLPAMTGVPARIFDLRQSFTFANLEPDIDRAHPWKALEYVDNPGYINGFADQTVIAWGLRKKLGDTLKLTDEKGRTLNIRLAGGLENSVFQGSILVSDSLLRLYYPSSVKIRNILLVTSAISSDSVIRILEERLRDEGAIVIPATERLATFEAVENAYLDVFIMLGGFGMVIGTAGMAVMALRNLRDRSRELALYSALGFSNEMIYRLLSGEFLFILLAGIFTGILAALTGTLPSVIHGSMEALLFPAILVGIIILNGLVWIHFPIKRSLKGLANISCKRGKL